MYFTFLSTFLSDFSFFSTILSKFTFLSTFWSDLYFLSTFLNTFLRLLVTQNLYDLKSQGDEILRECSTPTTCHVTCGMSHVTWHVSHVIFFKFFFFLYIYFFDKVVKPIVEGLLSTGSTPSILYMMMRMIMSITVFVPRMLFLTDPLQPGMFYKHLHNSFIKSLIN